VRLAAVRLIAQCVADFASNKKLGKDGLTGSYGLSLGEDDIPRFLRGSLGILASAEADERLAGEAGRLLLFLGGYLNAHGTDSVPDEDGEDDESDFEDRGQGIGLRYLFSRLAAVVRKEVPPQAPALVPKVAAMNVLEGLCINTPREGLRPSIHTILRPLRNLTDPSIPTPFSTDEAFKTRYEALKAKAQTIMEDLQKKLGTAAYTKHLLAVGDEARDRREQRSSKRKIETMTQPEKHGRDKRKKVERKVERRKIRGQEHRNRRRGY